MRDFKLSRGERPVQMCHMNACSDDSFWEIEPRCSDDIAGGRRSGRHAMPRVHGSGLSACETSSSRAADDRFGSAQSKHSRTTASGKTRCTAAMRWLSDHDLDIRPCRGHIGRVCPHSGRYAAWRPSAALGGRGRSAGALRSTAIGVDELVGCSSQLIIRLISEVPDMNPVFRSAQGRGHSGVILATRSH
jgi:hypothetical protein